MPLSLKMRTVLLMARLTGGKPLHELPVPEARQATTMQIPKSRTSVPLANITNPLSAYEKGVRRRRIVGISLAFFGVFLDMFIHFMAA